MERHPFVPLDYAWPAVAEQLAPAAAGCTVPDLERKPLDAILVRC